jgi:hypothetical protein
MAKQHTRKKYRGGTTVINQKMNRVQFTPIKSRLNSVKQQSPLAPQKLARRPLNKSGQSVRNLTQFFEEQALQPLEITYGHTQNNKPNTPKIRNNQSNVKYVIMKQLQPNNKHNTVRKTNKLRPLKQIAMQTRKNNQQKMPQIFQPTLPNQPHTLKHLTPTQLKTAKQIQNNIPHLANIWTGQNIQQV